MAKQRSRQSNLRRTRFISMPRRIGKRKMTIPLAVVAGFVPMALHTYDQYKINGVQGAGGAIVAGITGYQYKTKNFDFGNLNYGLWPILGGLFVHKLANRLGVNRMLAGSGIPLVRI